MWVIPMLLGHQQILTYPNLLGTTKSKDSGLCKHRGLRKIKAQVKLIDKDYFLHEASLSRLGDMAVLSNVQKPVQRVKENKEQRNMFQTNKQKNQDKCRETNLNET